MDVEKIKFREGENSLLYYEYYSKKHYTKTLKKQRFLYWNYGGKPPF